MSGLFGAAYADAYDPLYQDKDYEAECSLIESLAAQYGRGCRSILDLGCGTGRHAVTLAERGHEVTGIDRSADMLAIALGRAAAAGVAVDLRLGDVTSARVGRRFDAVLLMFAVLGYQLEDGDVAETLETAACHLVPGGVLVFDVWNGPAVEAIGPTPRTKTVNVGGDVIRRRATGTLDPAGRIGVVDYVVEWLDGDRTIRSEREQHRMRYFFREELQVATDRAGLDLVHDTAFPAADRPATTEDWSALYVARAR